MIRRLVSRKKSTWFLIILVIIYTTVWLYAFRQQYFAVTSCSGGRRQNDEVEEKCLCNESTWLSPKLNNGTKAKPLPRGVHGDSAIITAAYHGTQVDHSVPRYQRYIQKPFKSGLPKVVLILGYQRVGSSFFGKIFDLNPDIFYVYEPLDSLYQAMYGTASGFNIPSDITFLKNGNERILPMEEITAVTEFLTNVFNCRLDKLPTEFFVHSFWSFLPMFMPSWTPYLVCLKNETLTRGRDKCAHNVKCPRRFGSQFWKSDVCKHHLWINGSNKHWSGDPTESWPVSYKNCMTEVRSKAKKCIELMDMTCKSLQLRVVKTVRATMESVKELISHDQNLRIIHLIRDPRPVAVSRMGTITYHGLYAHNSTVREARVFCNILLRDLNIRRKLEKKYPGTFYEIVYDDFVKYPVEYAMHVYKFLDVNITDSLLKWIGVKTRGTKLNSKKRSKAVPKWKQRLTVEQSESILSICKDFYYMIDYKFE